MRAIKILIFISLIFIILIGCSKDPFTIQNHLENENRITTVYKYNDVNSLANPENKSNGLKLESIKSDDVDENGTSEKWIYSYTSGGIAVTYYYQATKNKVILDSISTIIKFPPTQLISHSWIDSNDLLKITENNGGYDFRAKNSEYKIEIKLEELLGYNSSTYWYVTYFSTRDESKTLLLVVDASNGELK
jgi:hypothetical protein